MTTDQPLDTRADRLAVRGTSESNFAWRLAPENTPMSWVGTAIFLAGLGLKC